MEDHTDNTDFIFYHKVPRARSFGELQPEAVNLNVVIVYINNFTTKITKSTKKQLLIKLRVLRGLKSYRHLEFHLANRQYLYINYKHFLGSPTVGGTKKTQRI